jgi:hypothetical protein
MVGQWQRGTTDARCWRRYESAYFKSRSWRSCLECARDIICGLNIEHPASGCGLLKYVPIDEDKIDDLLTYFSGTTARTGASATVSSKSVSSSTVSAAAIMNDISSGVGMGGLLMAGLPYLLL